MKVVTAKEMGRIEKQAYEQGCLEKTFMLHAGRAILTAIETTLYLRHIQPKIALLCGKGNNTGDAFVTGSLLVKAGFFVEAICLEPLENYSPLAKQMVAHFEKAGGPLIFPEQTLDLSPYTLLLDGVFGTGFHGEVDPRLAQFFEQVNQSKLHVISIDIPSGIDGVHGFGKQAIIANETVALGLPKTGCFLNEGWACVGMLHVYGFGLPQKYIDEAKADFIVLTTKQMKSMLPKVKRTRHKYQKGYVLSIAGCATMKGAGLLASYAALRAGAGIVRLFYASDQSPPTLYPELITEPFNVKRITEEMKRASGVLIGPGLGQTEEAKKRLEAVLSVLQTPCVFDADALNLIAKHQLKVPKDSILTPHRQEMVRLLGKSFDEDESFLEACKQFADQHQVVLVVKGSPTFVFASNQTPHVLSRGDPCMATAGSGDVLTGIIAAMLKTHMPFESALLGAFVHGIAGELVGQVKTAQCAVATDFIEMLPQVFALLESPNPRIGDTNL